MEYRDSILKKEQITDMANMNSQIILMGKTDTK